MPKCASAFLVARGCTRNNEALDCIENHPQHSRCSLRSRDSCLSSISTYSCVSLCVCVFRYFPRLFVTVSPGLMTYLFILSLSRTSGSPQELQWEQNCVNPSRELEQFSPCDLSPVLDAWSWRTKRKERDRYFTVFFFERDLLPKTFSLTAKLYRKASSYNF